MRKLLSYRDDQLAFGRLGTNISDEPAVGIFSIPFYSGK
jgi:hypothetical protein